MTPGPPRPNLSTVLELVHRRGPLSRASITEATGLNRSSVAALVTELVDRGLVRETAPAPAARVGRPSPVVAADPDVVAIAANPEVDAITVGAVGFGAAVITRERIPVRGALDPERAARQIASAIDRIRADRPALRVTGVGIAIPGLVDEPHGLVRWAPHLGWRDVPFAALLADRAGLEVDVANDASLGALAEHSWGAGRGTDDLVYLNGGASGIGGGLIVGGRLLGGTSGFAGEIGHNRVRIDAVDQRSAEGELELEVSRSRLLDVLGREDADEHGLAELLATVRDSAVDDEVARQQRILGVALANLVNVTNPARIVLGGFLAALVSPPARVARVVSEHAVQEAAAGVRIEPAALGEDRLLVGAAELPLGRLIARPAELRDGLTPSSASLPR